MYNVGTMANRLFTVALVVGLLAALTNIYLRGKAETRYLFHAEWYDPVSATVRKFQLSFFPKDNAVEMYDLRSNRLFLKRLAVDGLSERDMYVGNTVVVLSRQLKITDYADAPTRDIVTNKRERTFAMIKPDAVDRVGDVIQVIQGLDFELSQIRMVQLTRAQAGHFYKEHEGRPFYEALISYVTSGPVVALELITTNAVSRWREALGPTDSMRAREEAPNSIRARFGRDKQANAAHGSDSHAAATRELELFFPSSSVHDATTPQSSARLRDNTCCIVKPHAVAEGKLGGILSAVREEGYEVTGLQMFRLDKVQAEDFLEVYKGVVPEYPGMVQQLMSGPCVALEITGPQDTDTPTTFRELVGPKDPAMARELRPKSLRARFGEDKVRNAVHCSDLPDDGPLEVEYFFKILQ